MAILLGLTTALGWGTAAFLGRFTSRAIGAPSAMLFSQLSGFVIILAYLIVTGELVLRASALAWEWWLLGLLAAGFHTFGLLMTFRALEVGVLSVVTPIAGSSAAITVPLSLMSGERITVLNGIGMVLAVLGVALAARKPSDPNSESGSLAQGVAFALFSMVSMGVWFWVLGFQIAPRLGSSLPVMLVRISGVMWLSMFFFVAGKQSALRLPNAGDWGILIVQVVLATMAFIANITAYSFGNVSTQSVFASLNSAVAVMLGVVFLREPVTRTQTIGIVLVLIGIVLLSAQL